MRANPSGLKLRIVALALLAVLVSPAWALAQGPKVKTPPERAQQMLEREVGIITRLMHPTATYQSKEVTVVSQSGDRFAIVTKYYFKNFFNQDFYSSLQFNFTAKGKIEEIELGDRDAYIAPFMAADLGSNVVEVFRNNKEVTTLLRRGQVRSGLILWLNGAF